jgi:hypothetical protein
VPDQVLRKYMAPELEWWGMIDETEVNQPRFRCDNWQAGYPVQYVTNGPRLTAWVASVTQRDRTWRAPDTEIPPVGDPFRVDPLHFRLRFAAASPAGLAEVLLWDGPHLLRRWLPDGATTFARDLDFNHHQQMHLLLEVRDRQGRCALTRDYSTLRLDWCEFSCADRNNPLMIGFERDDRGLAYGWSGTLYLTYNNGPWGGSSHVFGRLWYGGDRIYPAPRSPVHDETCPSDGGVGEAGGGLHIFPQPPQEFALMVRSNQESIGPDCAIDSILLDRAHDLAWPWFFGRELNGFGLYPSHPTRHIWLRRRAWIWRPLPYHLTTQVYEYEVRWKKRPAGLDWLRVGWLDGEVEHVLHRADGTALPLKGLDDQPLELTWHHGECLVSWERGARPAIFYNDGPDLLLRRDLESDPTGIHHTVPQGRRLVLFLPADALPARLRFIAAGGTTDMRDPAIAERFCRAMGLVGAPAYALAIERGTLRSQRVILELDSHQGGVRARLGAAPLPAALPVIIHGLHPQWPAVLYDHGSRRWRPLARLEQTAVACLDPRRDWDLFLGHPITASRPEIMLHLAQTGERSWVLEVHNPTNLPADVTVRPDADCPLFAWPGATLHLAPGSSTILHPEVAP